MGKYEDAAMETRKAVDLEPDNALYHYSLGVTLHALEKYEDAAIETRKAIDLAPDIARYRNNLSRTLHSMN